MLFYCCLFKKNINPALKKAGFMFLVGLTFGPDPTLISIHLSLKRTFFWET